MIAHESRIDDNRNKAGQLRAEVNVEIIAADFAALPVAFRGEMNWQWQGEGASRCFTICMRPSLS